MRIVAFAGLALGVALGGTAAFADGTPPAQPAAQAAQAATTTVADSSAPAATPPAADPDRIVCRIGAPPTGSRLGARHVCHSQREWDQMRQEHQDMLTRAQTENAMGGMATH